MTKLTEAARNMIVLTPEFKNLVSEGLILRTKTFPEGAAFEGKPTVQLDRTSGAGFLVFTVGDGWNSMNSHNTLRFPTVHLDVWCSPLRNQDGSVKVFDADNRIEKIINAILPYFHNPNPDVAGTEGSPLIPYMGRPSEIRYWGTQYQISTRTGVPILHSYCGEEPEFRDVSDAVGARMARISFHVTTL